MKFTTRSVEINGSSGGFVYVEIDLSEADVIAVAGQGELLDEIGAKEVVRHFDASELLDLIGETAALDHFDAVKTPA